MRRWAYLSLAVLVVLGVVREAEPGIQAGEASCVRLQLFDVDFMPFQGLLVQKNEQVKSNATTLTRH